MNIAIGSDHRGFILKVKIKKFLEQCGHAVIDCGPEDDKNSVHYPVFSEKVAAAVVEARADKGEDLLKQMIARPGANRVGELSMTDGRMSRITKFMANTLYDENRGGKNGNFHIALGMSYKDTFDGDPRRVSKKGWEDLGYVDSGEHCDMVSTEDRKITAYLKNGKRKVIYKDGSFWV